MRVVSRNSDRAPSLLGHVRRRRPAFTLLETLVVAVVILSLTAILLPSLVAAREAGKAAVCLSNLKQMGHAVQMYTQDNRSFLPGPTSLLVFRSDVNVSGLGPMGLDWARRNLPYKLARYVGGSDKDPRPFDVLSLCPSADSVPLTGVYGGLPPPLDKQRCYYILNTGGIEHGIDSPDLKPWYATAPVNYFGYLRYNDNPDTWPEYEKTRRMPKSIQGIRNQSQEWEIADLWHWEARAGLGPVRNVGTWPFPVATMSSPSFCGASRSYAMPSQPFHNTTKRFSARGVDRQAGSPRLLTGKTNTVYFDGHAAPVREWKGTVNPCFRFDIHCGSCTGGL